MATWRSAIYCTTVKQHMFLVAALNFGFSSAVKRPALLVGRLKGGGRKRWINGLKNVNRPSRCQL